MQIETKSPQRIRCHALGRGHMPGSSIVVCKLQNARSLFGHTETSPPCYRKDVQSTVLLPHTNFMTQNTQIQFRCRWSEQSLTLSRLLAPSLIIIIYGVRSTSHKRNVAATTNPAVACACGFCRNQRFSQAVQVLEYSVTSVQQGCFETKLGAVAMDVAFVTERMDGRMDGYGANGFTFTFCRFS